MILYSAFGTSGTAASPVRPRPHGDPRDRPLAEPAPHLGRHDRLLGHRPRLRHAERAGAELRQADVPPSHLRQRSERRHVHELHGLHRRRRDVHVHAGAGHADECRTRGAALEESGGSRTTGTPTRRTLVPMTVDRAALERRWIHSHEEDSAGTMVFRPDDFAFPPVTRSDGVRAGTRAAATSRPRSAPPTSPRRSPGRGRSPTTRIVVSREAEGRPERRMRVVRSTRSAW